MLDTPAPLPGSPPAAARNRDRPDHEKLAISIVIPAYNEQGSIELTIRDTRAALDGLNGPWLGAESEIVIINDGSRDDTGPVAERGGAVVITHPHNLGYGAAIKTGILAAQHDTIVIMDADGTYPIGNLQELLDGYRKGFDMVIGARQGKHYRESFSKSLLRLILTFLVEFTTGRDVPDVNSGFRVFSKATVTPYFHNLCDTFSFTTSLTLAYMMTRRFVSYVPVPYGVREGTSKVRLLRDSLRTLEYIVLAATYYDPLKLFALLSVICIVLSFGGFGISFLFGIKGGYILGLGGLLVALMIFSTGLLASLLKQIMDKGRA
jgi:polyisoprenyl-phosphate glycosyltransferase